MLSLQGDGICAIREKKRSGSRLRNDGPQRLKGRLAEALVESIFHRAGYQVSRLGHESRVHRLVRIRTEELLPDFLVWKPVEESGLGRRRHWLLTVEATRPVAGSAGRSG